MSKTAWWRALLAALAFLLACARPALADDGRGGRVVFGEDFRLPTDQRIDGDLVVFGGDVTLEAGSEVRGSALAFGGRMHIAGRVERDAIAFGGDVELAQTARVDGDILALGGGVRDAGARIGGQVIGGPRGGLSMPFFGHVPGWPIARGRAWAADWPLGWDLMVGFLLSAARLLLGILALVTVGGLVVLLVPGLVQTASEALTRYPAESVGVGLLTGVAAALALPLLVITCIGIPVAAVALAALAIAALFGWIVAALALGERLLVALRQAEGQPLAAVALGLLLLALLAAMPGLGVLVTLLVGAWGLGATLLTRFGSQPYAGRRGPVVRPPELPAGGEGQAA